MKGFLAPALFLLSSALMAQPVFAPDGVAVRGVDVVAYFVDGQMTVGQADFETEWQGARWRFSSQANLDRFVEEPGRYAPRFGGFGSLTVAHGALIPSNPEAWVIHEDRLYLFFHKPARETWLMNPELLIPRAEEQWAAAQDAAQ